MATDCTYSSQNKDVPRTALVRLLLPLKAPLGPAKGCNPLNPHVDHPLPPDLAASGDTVPLHPDLVEDDSLASVQQHCRPEDGLDHPSVPLDAPWPELVDHIVCPRARHDKVKGRAAEEIEQNGAEDDGAVARGGRIRRQARGRGRGVMLLVERS